MIASAVWGPACFHPVYNDPLCGPGDACPPGWTCVSEVCKAPFDDAKCPPAYNVLLPGPTRYRLILEGHRAPTQSDACNLDLPGASHLAIFETQAEAEAVLAFMQSDHGIKDATIWIGAVQRPTATRPDEQWLWFDGRPVVNGWDLGEPNDLGDGDESAHEEQFAGIERGRAGMNDERANIPVGALCECDGKALDAEAMAAIAAYR